MSEFEYNNLLFQISQRLDDINASKQLLVICRGKVAARNEESIPTFSLFEELEDKGFLSSDRLTVLKAILKGVKEWAFLEEVEKFSCKRKEYNNLLEQIIRVLDDLNDLERLISICRRNITEGRRASIHDVRSLFKELESKNCLGIDCLEIVKEILTQTEKIDLLKEVEEFEQRQRREIMFERRKAEAAAIASSALDKLAGVLNIKTVFKVVAGYFTIASSFDLLIRNSSYDQLIAAVNTCVLPAGANLIQMTEGCVCLKVQVESLAALETLWRLYKDGTLKASLQALLVTDEIKELASGEHVEVVVTIEEQEYEKVRNKLANEPQENPDDKEKRRFKYLDQEKYDYIQNYLEQSSEHTKDADSHSAMTVTSDSGMQGSNCASSEEPELGTEDAIDSISSLYLKDLSKAVTAELSCRLRADPTALQRFHQAFGLDPEKLQPHLLDKIGKFFPDTPVKLLRDVFEELQLLDLVEMLEKVKPRTLRTSLPLKIVNVSGRPTKLYSKAEVLIIGYSDGEAAVDAYPDVDKIGSFFQALNSTRLTVKVACARQLDELKYQKMNEGSNIHKETKLKELLEKRLPLSIYGKNWPYGPPDISTDDEKQLFYKEEPAMKNLLEKMIEENRPIKVKIEKIEEEIQQKEEKVEGEKEKFKMAVSTVVDKWICKENDEDRESTLFVVLHWDKVNAGGYYIDAEEFSKTARRCLTEKLALVQSPKLIIGDYATEFSESIPQETLAVHVGEDVLALILELLKKRWKTLDLLSVLREAQRTLPTMRGSIPENEFYRGSFMYFSGTFSFTENLSFLPRLQKNEQNSEPSDL